MPNKYREQPDGQIFRLWCFHEKQLKKHTFFVFLVSNNPQKTSFKQNNNFEFFQMCSNGDLFGHHISQNGSVWGGIAKCSILTQITLLTKDQQMFSWGRNNLNTKISKQSMDNQMNNILQYKNSNNNKKMFEPLPTEEDETPKEKTLFLIENGQPQNIVKIQFHKPLSRSEIMESVAEKWWGSRIKNIRIYGIDSIELFDEDLLYLKNGDRVYVSKGDDFDSNRNFGEYQIIRTLGEGGFGSVSLGINKITNEYAAIKVVKTNKIISSNSIDMIFREAENMKSLSHPNIVKIINCYALQNMKFVVVMEYLEGGELKDLLKQKQKFQEEEARTFFKQIISAVHYCHRQGIVHRDLKLQNILLGKNNQAKVADFGISGVADRFNPQVDWGTLKYMPPQILSRKEKVNAFAGDVWACGIILFNMVEGFLPFSGNSSSQIIQRIISDPVQFSTNCQISSNCKFLIERMLQKNPRERISMDEIESSAWFLRGKQGSMEEILISNKKITKSESCRLIVKPRQLAKKASIIIPKRIEKEKNQALDELQGYRVTRKLFKSESKVLPDIRASHNRMNRQSPLNPKRSYGDMEGYKKSSYKPV